MKLKTLRDILNATEEYGADLNTRFRYHEHFIGNGYHVTELKSGSFSGIDCGGNVEHWMEASLQLLDGAGENCMKLGKFRSIVQQSIKSLSKLGQADLFFEFSPKNEGLRKLTLSALQQKGDAVLFDLSDVSASCKPWARSLQQAQSNGCYGQSGSQSQCCT